MIWLTMSGGVSTAARMKMRTIAYERLRLRKSDQITPSFERNIKIRGSWKERANASTMLMTKDR